MKPRLTRVGTRLNAETQRSQRRKSRSRCFAALPSQLRVNWMTIFFVLGGRLVSAMGLGTSLKAGHYMNPRPHTWKLRVGHAAEEERGEK
jgi:hypothetical protein